MIKGVGISTDNFFKFITTVSLLIVIYCVSFDTLFMQPHNNQIVRNNIMTAELSAKYGYSTGLLLDLEAEIRDSINMSEITDKLEYYYWDDKSKSESFRYYRTTGMDRISKKLLDSLNNINSRTAGYNFRLEAIESHNRVIEKSIGITKALITIIGIAFFIIMLWGLTRWYNLEKMENFGVKKINEEIINSKVEPDITTKQ